MEHARSIPLREALPAPAGLVRRARRLAQLGLAWHAIEAGASIAAGAVAGSVALVGFGADSLIEMLAAVVLLWRFAPSRAGSHSAEHGARKAIAWSFFLVASYIAIDATRQLAMAQHPEASWFGVGIAAFAALTMPPLAIAKQRNAIRLHSPAARGEGRQNMLCAYLSVALLAGLLANAALGLWWADPVAALFIGVVAGREGLAAWRGDDSCCGVAI